MDVSDTVARSLLIKYRWNKEMIMIKMSESEDLIKEVFGLDRWAMS